jgi:NADH:ubiquinone oxidoreductase subunit 5 (subunit L)/multisubunit Na+/H+ antiporter MnhA subunit
MGVGIIDHEAGTRDIRYLNGMRKLFPKMHIAMLIAALSKWHDSLNEINQQIKLKHKTLLMNQMDVAHNRHQYLPLTSSYLID